jgi:L-amino acid N-acyltransferase YncA
MVSPMKIRLAELDDLSAIVDIYNQAIASKQSTGDTQPVRVEDRMTWFGEHVPHEHPIFVAEVEGQVVG